MEKRVEIIIAFIVSIHVSFQRVSFRTYVTDFVPRSGVTISDQDQWFCCTVLSLADHASFSCSTSSSSSSSSSSSWILIKKKKRIRKKRKKERKKDVTKRIIIIVIIIITINVRLARGILFWSESVLWQGNYAYIYMRCYVQGIRGLGRVKRNRSLSSSDNTNDRAKWSA